MAGFKQSIQFHNPLLFITFDGDPYDNFTRKITSSPPHLIDETAYGNVIIVHNEHEDYPAYRMGLPSIVDLEPGDQHSCSFGWYGHQPSAPGEWPKAFLEVAHQDHLKLEENEGSFTLGFMMNKASTEQEWRNIENSKGRPYTMTLIRPLFRKAGSFYIWYQDNWITNDQLHVQYPGGSFVLTLPTNHWFYNKDHFFTLTYDVTEPNEGEYLAVATLYINARIVLQNTHTYFDSHPSSTSTAPIEIAGLINYVATGNNDRATSKTTLDQIFLLGKALSADEVARLSKKVKNYDGMLIAAEPTHYWPMGDAESSVSTTMAPMAGGLSGDYRGGTLQVLREQEGPPQILGGSSVYFHNGGHAVVHNTGSGGLFTPVFNPTGDFTVHFWCTFSNSDRSVLFALQRDETPFNGILVEANVRQNVNHPGHIQFSVNQNHWVQSLQTQDNGAVYNFADGRFHHVCVARRGNAIELWIDGLLHESKDAPISPVPIPGPGQVYLMGAAPGRMNTTGNMSSVVIYNRALDPQEIRICNLYSQIYRIRGSVTLQGTPHQATVRAISHRTGQLVREVLSDPNSGDYMIELYDNSLIDLMALNKQDRNIRYRVYGPITPAVFEDLP